MTEQPKDFRHHLHAYFRKGKIYVWKNVFAVVKSAKPHPGAFANIIDRDETTVIIEQDRIEAKNALAVEPGWRIITFDMVLPFNLTGFLAAVASALAEGGIVILAVSSFSTDHILVKDKDLPAALDKLRGLGFTVSES
jgi:hypothetical protein